MGNTKCARATLTKSRVSDLEDCCRCGNQAKADKKCKSEAGVGISLQVGCYDAAQPPDVDHPVESFVSKILRVSSSSRHTSS